MKTIGIILMILPFTVMSNVNPKDLLGTRICRDGHIYFSFCFNNVIVKSIRSCTNESPQGRVQGYLEDLSPNNTKFKIRIINYTISQKWLDLTEGVRTISGGRIESIPLFNNEMPVQPGAIVWDNIESWYICE